MCVQTIETPQEARAWCRGADEETRTRANTILFVEDKRLCGK